MIDEENLTSETGLDSEATDLVKEASALNEMSNRVKHLEDENSKLKEAKKMYYDSILNGQTAEENVPTVRTRDEIRKDLFGRDEKDSMNNLEYAQLVVELDDACIREEGESCFLPKGRNVIVSADERDSAERFHQVLEDCIEEADGNPEIFNQALTRRIKRK